MKNVKNLFAAVCALASTATMAVIYQPGAHVSEDAPVRVGVGVGAGLIYNKDDKIKDLGGFGVNNTGLGLSFAHNVGYDFTYGIAVGFDAATPGSNRLFSEDWEKRGGGKEGNTGLGVNTDLLARFMPEIADGFRLGGRFNVGYYGIFGSDKGVIAAIKKDITFGDVNFRVGPAFDWRVTDMFCLYFSPAVGMNSIRFASKEVKNEQAFKDNSNFIGAEAVLEGTFHLSENMGLTLGTTTNIRKFKDFNKNKDDFKQDVVLGLNFAM